MLLLSCGHVSIFFDEAVPATEVDRWRWTCDQCEAEDQEAVTVCAALTSDQVESMTEEQLLAIVENAS